MKIPLRKKLVVFKIETTLQFKALLRLLLCYTEVRLL